MSIDPATIAACKHAETLKSTKPTIDKRLKDVSGKLLKAIADKDAIKIKLYLKALADETNVLTKAMRLVEMAVLTIDDVEKDEEFMNTRLADLEKVTTIVDDARKAFTAWYKATKALETKAKQSSEAAKDADADATRIMAGVDAWVADAERAVTAAYTKAPQLEQDAFDAVEQHDAKALEAAQREFEGLDIGSAMITLNEAKENCKSALERIKKAPVRAEQRAELMDDLKDFQSRLNDLKDPAEELAAMAKKVPALAIAKVDVSKAAKALSIDRKGEAQLAKVLRGPADKWAQGLEALAKQLGIKTRGKDMVQQLDKAGIG